MAKPTFLENIDEIFFNDPKKQGPDIQKLETLIRESLQFFDEIRTQLQSPKEEERKEAMDQAKALQHKLEDLADKSLAEAGMTREQLTDLLANPQNFAKEDWDSYKKAEEEISTYKKEVLKTPEQTSKKKKTKTDKQGWLKS